jgi:hypothetical protein
MMAAMAIMDTAIAAMMPAMIGGLSDALDEVGGGGAIVGVGPAGADDDDDKLSCQWAVYFIKNMALGYYETREWMSKVTDSGIRHGLPQLQKPENEDEWEIYHTSARRNLKDFAAPHQACCA